jgi:hypothetical protein
MTERVAGAPELLEWFKQGSPLGPVDWHVKAYLLTEMADLFECNVLVETGTYDGKMLGALLDEFDELYSVELSDEYFRAAQLTFGSDPKVHLYQGDSAEVLPVMLADFSGPAVVFLDAHFMGGDTARGVDFTPIWAELRALAVDGRRHVVMIDDIEEFKTNPEYPSLDELFDKVGRLLPRHSRRFEANELILEP